MLSGTAGTQTQDLVWNAGFADCGLMCCAIMSALHLDFKRYVHDFMKVLKEEERNKELSTHSSQPGREV